MQYSPPMPQPVPAPGMAAPPPSPPQPPAPPTSPLRLPGQALRLAARFWPVLVLFFTLGAFARDVIMYGTVKLTSRGERTSLFTTEYTTWRLLAVGMLSIATLLVLTMTVLMLLSVRRGLPGYQAAVAEASATGVPAAPADGQQDRRLVEMVSETLLPFLILYGAWGLLSEDIRTFAGYTANENLDVSGVSVPGGGWTLVVAATLWLARAVSEKVHDRVPRPGLRVLTAIFEAGWMYFAVFVIYQATTGVKDWITSRVFWVSGREAVVRFLTAAEEFWPAGSIDQARAATGWVLSWLPDIRDAVVLPLVWLVVVATVYGHKMADDASVIAGSRRLAPLGRGWQRLPARVRVVTEFFSRDLRDKLVPALNGLRLVLHSGWRFFLTFCLCYALLGLALKWGWILATQLIGPHDWRWWQVPGNLLSYGRDMVLEVLRVCLLAVTFDMILTRRAIHYRSKLR